MKYVFDANAVISLGRGDNLLRGRVTPLPSSLFGISAIAAHELFYGAAISVHHAKKLARVDAMSFQILPFDADDARVAAELRVELGRIGRPIGPFDALIAGQALARKLTLITHNIREFSRVEGLAIEDWEV